MFKAVRVVDIKSASKPTMRLHRKTIEQGYDRFSDTRFFRKRIIVKILGFCLRRGEHLSAGTKELNLLALDKVDVKIAPFKKRMNLNYG